MRPGVEVKERRDELPTGIGRNLIVLRPAAPRGRWGYLVSDERPSGLGLAQPTRPPGTSLAAREI